MENDVIRTSVRRMVEFSLRSGDITPVSMDALQAGTRGHIARQKESGAHSERTVRWTGEYLGLSIEISGRIDVLHEEKSIPLVEEIKLLSPDAPLPDAPLPAHRMQAICYAHMLCEECDLSQVSVQISYVTELGEIRAAFSETLTSKAAKEHFESMLQPFAAWEKALFDFRVLRNASLAALPFPYAAFRPGQREMAAQVYTAIKLQKRLFASLPTGTGKSAATLYPALKAMGEGKTKQIFYLTARGTAQQAANDALSAMRERGLRARSVVLTAKEKCCPMTFKRCHPDHCPRAKGHFDRERAGLYHLLATDNWHAQTIAQTAEQFMLCPFELSLSLCEIADVVICDYNYAFDPAVHLQRIFDRGTRVTMLIDEAHNLPSRVRGMLGATLSTPALIQLRRETGKTYGRTSRVYKAFSALIREMRNTTEQNTATLYPLCNQLIDILQPLLSQPQGAFLIEGYRDLLAFRAAFDRQEQTPDDYCSLLSKEGQENVLQILALDVSAHLRQSTKRTSGCVFFSATLSPLEDMKNMLGGKEDDAVFALPSPFPERNLLVLQRSIDTRYASRLSSMEETARCILALIDAAPGSYIAFFPSYAYMEKALEQLTALRPGLNLNVQSRGMDDVSRESFLHCIRQADGPLLSLCVMGGVFSEGVDLPGTALIGAIIVGVGLPQVCSEQERLRLHYDKTLGDGFSFAYRYPGMHKVLQAAGRVIRSESDLGVILLLDARYAENAYARLLPAHYKVRPASNAAEIHTFAKDFWHGHGIIQ